MMKENPGLSSFYFCIDGAGFYFVDHLCRNKNILQRGQARIFFHRLVMSALSGPQTGNKKKNLYFFYNFHFIICEMFHNLTVLSFHFNLSMIHPHLIFLKYNLSLM